MFGKRTEKNKKIKEIGENMEIPVCENCGNPIDDCNCVCPYCGETSLCDCCIGLGAVTGG